MDTQVKPLQPIQGGKIVIIGVKASNVDDAIRNHPQVVLWSSLEKNWTDKRLPDNTRAVFFTRWIGHMDFARIQKEARNRHITLFNPDGTGMIAKQVKELLNMTHTPFHEMESTTTVPNLEISKEQRTEMIENKEKKGKLTALHPFVDYSKGATENARVLIEKAKEMGINTTVMSLAQMVTILRKKRGMTGPKTTRAKAAKVLREPLSKEMDVTIQMFDDIIKQLSDMRAYLIATVNENNRLRQKVDKFKKFFDE